MEFFLIFRKNVHLTCTQAFTFLGANKSVKIDIFGIVLIFDAQKGLTIKKDCGSSC